jgi:predicted DNA-binding antitoxin AbrB/MazE fold protein
MGRVLEAVYENGVLTPLEILDLPERQRVTIIIHIPAAEGPDEILEAWQRVYDELSDQDIAEIERITLDRSHFMRQEN